MAVVEQRGSVTVASAVTEEEIPPKVSLFDGTSNKSLVGPAFCENERKEVENYKCFIIIGKKCSVYQPTHQLM